MDLPEVGSSVPPRLPPEPPDAVLDVMLPVDPPDPPVPPDPPPALCFFHHQISSLCTLHHVDQKGLLLLLENYPATWNFNSKSTKLRALSTNLEDSVLSPENPHISSRLMGSIDQRFRPSSVKANWLWHGNVGVQSFDLTKVYAVSLNPAQLSSLVWYDVFNGSSMVLVHRLASVDRVHIARSRDVVLKFVPLFLQLSQAIQIYRVFAPFLMIITAKSRQRRPFLAARSHPPMVLSVTSLLVDVKESLSGHDLEALDHGCLGHSYIGSPVTAEAMAMRSTLCLELTLEWIFSGREAKEPRSESIAMNFVNSPLMVEVLAIRSALIKAASIRYQRLKMTFGNLTLVRAINGNTRTKEAFGVLQDIQQISSVFTDFTVTFSPCDRNREADFLAKRAIAQAYLFSSAVSAQSIFLDGHVVSVVTY